MSGQLPGFKIDAWYKGVIAVALVALVAALAVNNNRVAIIAVGGLIFGFGEWINHPKRSGYLPRTAYHSEFIISSTARSPSPFGTLLDIAGLGLIAYGVYRLFDF